MVKCALRELKEETGYTGVAKHTSPGELVEYLAWLLFKEKSLYEGHFLSS